MIPKHIKIIQTSPDRLFDVRTSLAARVSTLYGLTGLLDASRNLKDMSEVYRQILLKMRNIQALWHNKLAELEVKNWLHLVSTTTYAGCVNCCPNFIQMKPLTFRCSQASICPFCYSRDAQEVADKAWTVFKGIPTAVRSDYAMLGYRHIFRPKPINISAAMTFECKDRKYLYSYPGFSGGYVNSTFEPIKNHRWKVTRRVLALVPATFDTKAFAAQYRNITKIELITEYDRSVVSKLVGSVLRYPRRLLLDGDAGRIVQFLHAKSRFRLGTPFGVFRKTR